MGEEHNRRWCFHCLQRRIGADFSEELAFSYGVSDSGFPFGSTAIVHVPFSGRDVSVDFELVYLPCHEHKCLTNFVDEYLIENPECYGCDVINEITSSAVNQDQGDACHGFSNDKTKFVPALVDCHCFSSGYKKPALYGMGYKFSNCGCNYCGWFSCSRTMAALAPVAHVATPSYSTFENLASNFLSGSVEDHVLKSLSLLIEGKAAGRDSLNFLNLIGIPSFSENNLPGCLRHPNIVPVLAMLKSSDYVNLVFPKTPYTLENVLNYSPNALKSEWQIKFLLYQLLSALSCIHGLGVAHGNVCPSNVKLSDSYWLWLRICDNPQLNREHINISPSRISCCTQDCPSDALYADLKLSSSIDWHSAFNQWWKGELSNFEYLIILNKLAGRRWGDHSFHIVMPWVIDFSTKPESNSEAGWRDLSKSKWRLAKGDEQLDFTYSTSEIPHHVSDECLSELAVCSYKARRLPLSVLRMAVRSVYEPNEYPLTMQRLYQWTPDECIPEFYCDPQIFSSVHSGMTDLAVPTWAGNPEEFIKMHRYALESDRVSLQIHQWIDITFGYKMSGQAAVAAKNVMLPSSEPTTIRSLGRRQLFSQPHPVRLSVSRKISCTNELTIHQCHMDTVENKSLLPETAYLQELENVSAFCEHAAHLSPLYCYLENCGKDVCSIEEQSSVCFKNSISSMHGTGNSNVVSSDININNFIEYIEVDDDASVAYQELLLWIQKLSFSRTPSKYFARDIFSVGCILAELHLRRPLFNSITLEIYLQSGVLPALLQELPPHSKVVVEACIRKDWRRRPSVHCLLESPYFPATVRSAYLFLAPLQLLAKEGSHLCYAANFAKQGGLKAMGPFAAEMCAPYCLPLLLTLSDTDAELAYTLLREFLKCLRPKAVRKLIVSIIQKILQATGYSHLKVSLLQDSFVRELWKRVGKQFYLEKIHPLVLANLCSVLHKSSAAAASVLLIGSSEELGVPVTVHQTILPLIQCFGKGLCTEGIDALVRIGGLFGENFVIRQFLPLLKNVVQCCIDVSYTNKPEPLQNWSALACIDCLMVLDGLVAILPNELVVKELPQDGNWLHVTLLTHAKLDLSVLQVAATTLIAICQQIGPELTALHVLPQMKVLFDELAFSQNSAHESLSASKSLKVSMKKVDEKSPIQSRMDLVLLLYPSFASLLGIERLRQCCATWLLLEKFLLRCHNWKWEYTGESSKSGAEILATSRPVFGKGLTSDYSPAKMLLNGVGWSIPQSQGSRGVKNPMPQKQFYAQNPIEMNVAALNVGRNEPWFWFPSPASSWEGPDFLGRSGGLKDEPPWKIKASVIYSVRAHHGAVRSLAVWQDECAVFTAGVGPGFKGTVQKLDLTRINHVYGYYGHEEVVNDICVLSSSGRVASSDGTVHVWNSQTGKVISVFSESSADSSNLASSLSSAFKGNNDQGNMLNSNSLTSGIFTSAFDGALYTCMHLLEFEEKLIVGTGNGSLRFIDVGQGQKLHLWNSEGFGSSFHSLISAISSSGSDKMQTDGAAGFPSWIAAGLSSGHCRLFDARSGNVFAAWRAHDGYVTKLAAPEDHLLVSSSLDKTIRIWDLRRNFSSEPIVVRGHTDGVSSFSVWGQDIISISRNKIGLSSLSRPSDEDGHHWITPHKLYMSDRGTRNLSVLSSISIMPFSRLFLVGTDDGHLRICC